MKNLKKLIKIINNWPEDFCIIDCNGANYTVRTKSIKIHETGNILADKRIFNVETRPIILNPDLIIGIMPIRPKVEDCGKVEKPFIPCISGCLIPPESLQIWKMPDLYKDR